MQIMCLLGTFAYLYLATTYETFNILYLIVMFIVGGSIYTLYPLAINFTCDQISQQNTIKAILGLLLVYSFGSILGPLILSVILKFFNPFIFFLVNSFVLGIMTFYVFYSSIISIRIKPKSQHTIIPTSTSVIPELNQEPTNKK